MARGRQTPPATVEKILAHHAVSGNALETSRVLKIPVSTVHSIVMQAECDDGFAKYRREKRIEFVDLAWEALEVVLKQMIAEAKNCKDFGQLSIAVGILSDKVQNAAGFRIDEAAAMKAPVLSNTNNTNIFSADEISKAIESHQAERKHAGGNGNGSGTSRVKGVPTLP